MKTALHWLAGLLAAVAIAASFHLDNSYITAVHWLLAGLGAFCLVGVVLGFFIELCERSREELDFRTADGFLQDRQAKRLQKDASKELTRPSYQRSPFRPPARPEPTVVTSLDKAYQATLAQAKESGEAAGCLQAQGGPVAVNPHKKGSRAHLVWMTSCEAMLEGKAAADAHALHGTSNAVHTSAHA